MAPDRHDADFQDDLTALIPQMRAFARTLCGHAAAADDLAQDGLVRAWQARASYTPGTNLKAWTFMILRNQFYSDKRRSWRQRPLDQDVAERTLIARDNPDATLELDEVRRALTELPVDQREAIILVGAGGLAYEEAAEIMGCAVGTVKSRVSRGRQALAFILDQRRYKDDAMRPSQALSSLFGEADRLSGRAAA